MPPKYISLKEVVDEIISDHQNNKKFVWCDLPKTAEEEIVTEDAEYEIVEPKQLQ